jgi:acetoin utilization deacetylase AcuC-like enzyme
MSVRLVYRPEYTLYDFGPEHPLRPERLTAGMELLSTAGLLRADSELWRAPPATLEELRRVHSADYIEAVRSLELRADATSANQRGLGPGDTPAFRGMHAAASLIAGGTLNAVRAVLIGECAHAFNPAGGLHHAQRDRAAGFCIYNDVAVGIAAALAERNVRVLYLDFDAHHADGVQAAFYAEPRVLTLSLHETGRRLFPGTGFSEELGHARGRGFSVNLPMEPFTEDDDWLAGLEALVRPVAEWFAPDIVVSQHGSDSHAWDPLTHLRLSTRAYVAQARLAHQLAHQLAGGRWVALGGGGYDWLRVVPRSWAIVWAEMAGRALAERLPTQWCSAWAQRSLADDLGPLPATFLDDARAWPIVGRRAAIRQINRQHLDAVRSLALPPLVRHAFSREPDGVERSDVGGAAARTATLGTERAALRLRTPCSLTEIEHLRANDDLVGVPRLLRRVVRDKRGLVGVAHTDDGWLVAHATLGPVGDGTYELALETSRAFRRLGVARQLLRLTLESGWLEEAVLVIASNSWHWDLSGSGLDASAYRRVLLRLFGDAGFRCAQRPPHWVGTETNGLLMVRAGSRVSHAQARAAEDVLSGRQLA